MNYLKNQFMFKFFHNIFRMAKKSEENLQSIVQQDVKKNRSDSLICTKRTEQDLNDKECQTVLNHKSEENLVSNSFGKPSTHDLKAQETSNMVSNTSSEHSFRGALDKKKSFVDLLNRSGPSTSTEHLETKAEAVDSSKSCTNQELEAKLKKLKTSLKRRRKSEESFTSKQKRSYPWQNFNLETVLKDVKPEKQPKLCSSSSEISLTNSNSSGSLRSAFSSKRSSLSSVSDISMSSMKSLEGYRNQEKTKTALSEPHMPLYKSILKKNAQDQEKLSKQVKFTTPATLYYPSPSAFSSSFHQTKTHLSTGNIQSKHPMVKNINTSIQQKLKQDNEVVKNLKKNKLPPKEEPLGRCEPLKEELSFLYLYKDKKPKI